jgi:RHH-type proline utilization regulon transcriptional repressor/proline dehydrogenase/delta 1-pyrroline-5-carboxylate dehydrogenase
MDDLVVGDPARINTDVGPVIDDDALAMLEKHAAQMVKGAKWSHRARPAANSRGRFFAPLAVEIESLASLQREVFGPVVHVVSYRARDLDSVVAAVNSLGYGLTFGIHTRIDGLAQRIARTLRVGNVYINRNMIGAVVGVQPFGGEGLSGTGPKAGGPHYLFRFAVERTLTVNTAAAGGNAALLAQDEL